MKIKTPNSVATEQQFQQYEGIGKFTFKLVNPTAKEVESLTGMALQKEPEYITKDESGKITGIRLTFYGILEDSDGNFQQFHNFSLFLKNQYKENSVDKWETNGHKYMYIDRFGNTTWSTDPVMKRDGFKFDYSNCHKCFDGEKELINLIIAMNPDIVTGIWDYDNNTKAFSLKDNINLEDAECYLEEQDVKDIWMGKLDNLLSVFKGACKISTQIKLAIGSKDNSSYPVTYTRNFLSGTHTIDRAIKVYSKLIEKDCSSKEHYPSTVIHIGITTSNTVINDSSIDDSPISVDDMPFDE